MNESAIIDKILNQTKTIAIVGLSVDTSKPSFIVGQYLQKNGYKICPIYPKFEEVLGEKIYRKLDDIEEKIDLVLMFRKGSFAANLLPIIIQKGIKNFWLQLGIFNNEVQKECQKLGISFIQNKCIMRELPLYINRKNYN
ncbi:CoA-binding protein [Campylobacter estrildidarum]|uniref:CoA-binding protein n=1 Tax=Campylobacter estrildidarum TaxID=2510189 RepID=A0A4U7BKY3_9BACT|nr:CoA-binding protein [Campylobacter estrildidarum]TKX30925.1 CoA-binding protein [Campylobacter estrildidarum]